MSELNLTIAESTTYHLGNEGLIAKDIGINVVTRQEAEGMARQLIKNGVYSKCEYIDSESDNSIPNRLLHVNADNFGHSYCDELPRNWLLAEGWAGQTKKLLDIQDVNILRPIYPGVVTNSVEENNLIGWENIGSYDTVYKTHGVCSGKYTDKEGKQEYISRLFGAYIVPDDSEYNSKGGFLVIRVFNNTTGIENIREVVGNKFSAMIVREVE